MQAPNAKNLRLLFFGDFFINPRLYARVCLFLDDVRVKFINYCVDNRSAIIQKIWVIYV